MESCTSFQILLSHRLTVSLMTDINAHDQYGKTSLHCAVASQRLEMVKYLLRHKADVNSTDDRNDIPLHTAVRTGQLEVVQVSKHSEYKFESSE